MYNCTNVQLINTEEIMQVVHKQNQEEKRTTIAVGDYIRNHKEQKIYHYLNAFGLTVYSGRVRHTARSFRTRLPEFEDTLSVIWTHPVPVKQVSASGTGCY